MTAATTPGAAPRIPLLVALDLDGTTIDHSGGLSPAVREAVTAVVAAGHHLVISTGRSIVATLPIVRLLGLERGYAVCSNGAVTLALDRGAAGRVPGHRHGHLRPAPGADDAA